MKNLTLELNCNLCWRIRHGSKWSFPYWELVTSISLIEWSFIFLCFRWSLICYILNHLILIQKNKQRTKNRVFIIYRYHWNYLLKPALFKQELLRLIMIHSIPFLSFSFSCCLPLEMSLFVSISSKGNLSLKRRGTTHQPNLPMFTVFALKIKLEGEEV